MSRRRRFHQRRKGSCWSTGGRARRGVCVCAGACAARTRHAPPGRPASAYRESARRGAAGAHDAPSRARTGGGAEGLSHAGCVLELYTVAPFFSTVESKGTN